MCRRSNKYAAQRFHIVYIYIRPVSSDFLRGARASKPANRVPPWRKIGEWWWNGSSFCPVSTFAWIIGRFSSRSLQVPGCPPIIYRKTGGKPVNYSNCNCCESLFFYRFIDMWMAIGSFFHSSRCKPYWNNFWFL